MKYGIGLVILIHSQGAIMKALILAVSLLAQSPTSNEPIIDNTEIHFSEPSITFHSVSAHVKCIKQHGNYYVRSLDTVCIKRKT